MPPAPDVPFVFMTEPDKNNCTSRKASVSLFHGKTRGAVGLSIMFSRAQHKGVGDVAERLYGFWMDAASHGESCVRAKAWMSSTSVVVKSLCLGAEFCMAPIVWCPLPRWLKTWSRERASTRQFGYEVPSSVTMEESSVCINIWSRQWAPPLQSEVMSWAVDVLTSRRQAHPKLFPLWDTFWPARCAVRRYLHDWLGTLCDMLDACTVVHRVVGDACGHVQVTGAYDIVAKLRVDPKVLAIALLVVLLPKHAHLGQASMGGWVDALCRQVGVARAAPRDEEGVRAAQAAQAEARLALTDEVVKQVRALVLMSPVEGEAESNVKRWGPCMLVVLQTAPPPQKKKKKKTLFAGPEGWRVAPAQH